MRLLKRDVTIGSVDGGGSFFEDGGYGDVGEAGGYGLPFFAGSEVGVEFYVAVVEWFEFFFIPFPAVASRIGSPTLQRGRLIGSWRG